MAIHIGDPVMEPDPLVPGKHARGTVEISSDGGRVVSVVLRAPGGLAIPMYDDGTHGDEVAGDGVFTLQGVMPPHLPSGSHMAVLVATDDRGNAQSKIISITVAAP